MRSSPAMRKFLTAHGYRPVVLVDHDEEIGLAINKAGASRVFASFLLRGDLDPREWRNGPSVIDVQEMPDKFNVALVQRPCGSAA